MPALGVGEGPSPLSCHIPHHAVGTMEVCNVPRGLHGQKTHRLASRTVTVSCHSTEESRYGHDEDVYVHACANPCRPLGPDMSLLAAFIFLIVGSF